MEALLRLRDSFMGYISPVKLPRATPPQSPTKANFLADRRKSGPALAVEGFKSQKVITGRVTKLSYKSTSKKNIGGRKVNRDGPVEGSSTITESEQIFSKGSKYTPTVEELDEEVEVEVVIEKEIEFDDDEPTFVNDDDDNAEYEEGKQLEQYSEEEEESLRAEEEDLEKTLVDDDIKAQESEESQMSGEDKVRNYLSNQTGGSRKPSNSSTRSGSQGVHDWHEDELALWRQFEARGNEPILPAHWSQDFRTFNSSFFSTNLEETFINSASGADFQGIRALLALINLGPRVRERRQAGLPREPTIEKEFNNYMKWAEKDGGYSKKEFIPIHTVVSAKPGMPIKEMSSSLEAQLSLLALHHRRHLEIPNKDTKAPEAYTRPPPLLYGILIVRSRFIVCTLDSALEGDDVNLRTLAAFDFSEVGMDIWNSFAMAIVVITVRNYLMRLNEIGELSSAEESSDTDPDL